MTVQIREEPASALVEYARVPIAFVVRERLALRTPAAGLGGLHLVPEPVNPPWTKDYDANPDHHPSAWARRFDLAPWGILAAYVGLERVGGAVIAWGTPAVDLLEGRSDLAVIWDLRVAPAWRERGVGAALFQRAEAWALARSVRWLKVETQNVNAGACRFYARQGCVLGAIHCYAYPELPDEAQLLWYKPVQPHAGATASLSRPPQVS